MTDVSQYLLKFDFDELQDSINTASSAYTELGEALQYQVGGVMSMLDEVALRAAVASSATSSSENATSGSFKKSSEGLHSTLKMLSHMVAQSDSLSAAVRRMSDAKSGGGSSLDIQSQQAEISEMDKALSEVQVAGRAVQTLAQKNAEQVALRTDKFKKDTSMLGKLAQSEARGLSGSVSGILNHIPGGIVGGGIIAGLIAAMVHGVKIKADQEAFTGEVRNVIEASGDSLSSEAAMKATTFFSEFGYQAEALYKITKAESLSVLKTMVDSGYKSKALMAEYSQYLGEVGANIPMVSIGLDKTFELQTGTSIKHITQMATDFGGSVKNATADLIKISFAGQRSAMGVENYTNSVLSAASSMKQYGVEVESVAVAMSTVQKYYKSMGLNSQYSGARAAETVQGMADSLANLPYAQKVLLAKKAHPEMSNVDAGQWFEDGYKRARSGGNIKFFETMIAAAYTELTGDGDGGEAGKIRRLELQTGMANQHAAAIVRLGGDISSGNKLSEASKAEWDSLSNSLKDEQTKVDRTEALEFKLSMALADIGQGLLKILMGLVALLAHGFMNITDLVKALYSQTLGDKSYSIDDMLKESDERWQAILPILTSGMEQGSKGINDAMVAVGDAGLVDIKPVMDALSGKGRPAPENKYVPEVPSDGMAPVPVGDKGSDASSPSIRNVPTVDSQRANFKEIEAARAQQKAWKENPESVEQGGPRSSLRVSPKSKAKPAPPPPSKSGPQGAHEVEIPLRKVESASQDINAGQVL